MTRSFYLFLLCLTLAFPMARANSAEHPSTSSDWELTFADEFDGDKLDQNKWFPGYRLGRIEYYQKLGFPYEHARGWQPVPPIAHYIMQDGILRLRVDKELPKRDNPTTPTVSALTTSISQYNESGKTFTDQVHFKQRLGWFEIRCRVPRGNGSYTAFWLHQVGMANQEYTLEGKRKGLADGPLEIDIFELLGIEIDKRIIQFNVHFTKNGHAVWQMPFDPTDDFHTWALYWEEERLTWFCDGNPVRVYEGATPPREMYILVAMFQIGGWSGKIDPKMNYPLDFEIDYIRVWKKK